MGYAETIAYLLGLEASRGWDLKLERVRKTLARLGNPQDAIPSVLIAGTNGKGTTAALVAHALSAQGYAVGLYTSPHLVHFTERILLEGHEISRDRVVDLVARIRAVAPPEQTGLTFFEMTTVLAFLAFAEAQLEVCVLEVGLGGRLDATNVVEPTVSAITSIGLDHQAWLGSTECEIALEKAGVFRRDRPSVLGEGISRDVQTVLQKRAAEVGAKLIEPGVQSRDLQLVGAHMERNADTAAALLAALGSRCPGLAVAPAVREHAFARTRWPGRLDVQFFGMPLWIDGAHNVEAAVALREGLPVLSTGEPYRLLFAAMDDKPWRAIVSLLAADASEVALVGLEQRRAVAPDELATAFPNEARVRKFDHPAAALAAFARESSEAPVLVAGSLFLAGAVYEVILESRGLQSIFELGGGEF